MKWVPLCHFDSNQRAVKLTYELKSTRGFFHANTRIDTLVLTYSSSHSETVVKNAILNWTSRKINENLTYLETRRIYSRSQGLHPISDSMEKVSGPESIVCESYPFKQRFEQHAAYYSITVEPNMSIFICNSYVSTILDAMELVSRPESSICTKSIL